MLPILLSLLLAAPAAAAPHLDCGTPGVLTGLHSAPALPAAVGVAAEWPASERDKTWYGTPYDTRVDTENFTINWVDPGDADAVVAEAAGVALEAAWAVWVEQLGWPLPVSADQFLLWVILDPDLGSTGLTVEYETDEYPQGYPVIFLDPQWLQYPDFFEALAQHEFMHAIQYAMRDVWNAEGWEAWYWEASAQWAPELASPATDGYAGSSWAYSTQPWLRFDSMDNQHQYGMFVFNAWLDEALGAGTMRAVWELSGSAGLVPWDGILQDATGLGVEDLWPPFVGAMGNNELPDSAVYEDVLIDAEVQDGFAGRVAYLGTDYFVAPFAGVVEVELPTGGEVAVLGSSGDHGASVEVEPGEVVGVVGLTDGGADYILRTFVGIDDDDAGDDDDAADDDDVGDDDDDAADDDDASDDDDSGDDDDDDGGRRGRGCACGAGGAGGILLLPLLAIRRRRERPDEAPAA